MALSMAIEQYAPNTIQARQKTHYKPNQMLNTNGIHRKVVDICQKLIEKQKVNSAVTMKNAGFHYTDNKNVILCDTCGLQVFDWTSDMQLFTIHAQLSSACSFVRSRLLIEQASVVSSTNFIQSVATLNDREELSKCRKIEIPKENCRSSVFAEVDTLKQVRKRTFSHWPHRTSPSSEQMIEAGFFNCNVGDRVICLYCNIICQQWVPYIDDPCEIHKILSPTCPYVVAKLTCSKASSIPIINEDLSKDNSIRYEQIVSMTASNTSYRETPKRYASFSTWPNENLPSVDDLVKAGFFYTGTKTIVTCFYCNGSLQNWGANDDPMIEHARWFPHCTYAKQLCGDKLYRNIQESKRRQKEREEKNTLSNRCETSMSNSSSESLSKQNENILSRLVAARLDLPISQRLLAQNFKLSIIKRCWEDQLRIKDDDFVSDSDLITACTILQKQIQYIGGKKENIVIPNEAIKKLREKQQTEVYSHEQPAPERILVNTSNNTDVEMSTSSESITCETTTEKSLISMNKKMDTELNSADISAQKRGNDSSPLNPCALCLTEEKCLGCIPCGHVATCVPCGHSLQLCPICRSDIKAFVRLYL
ncbi:unnamed protein product [Rotaria sordida]|uniref:RING-type domain-containing protein n=1 Tax=Rotaria sordida TaxID=392033 RepID=A0A819GZE3_9BILA|nr:unnamed protein product [Rotaria sordida]